MKAPLFRVSYGVALAFAIVYAFFTLRGAHGISALLDKRDQIRQIEMRNTELERDNRLRRERIGRLAQSQAEQELEIRQRLKLVKPNEKVYILK